MLRLSVQEDWRLGIREGGLEDWEIRDWGLGIRKGGLGD
jgi:hypothetical protein